MLITLASRFQRLSWKYAAMAYATTLKNVGVVYQTMYLVATAMGLAPCALGGGNADRFAAAAGAEYCAESSVGEFLLGSKAPGRALSPLRARSGALQLRPSVVSAMHPADRATSDPGPHGFEQVA